MTVRTLTSLAAAACIISAMTARSAEDNQAFEKIERGRYLAVAGDCIGCHTAPGGKPFAGGAALETPFGTLLGPNITPDVATGIGGWSEEDFWRTLHEGIGRNGVRLYPAMPYPAYTKVTREDANAIFAYLGTLDPVRNEVRANQLEFPFNLRRPATSTWDLIRPSRRLGIVAPIWSRVSAIAEPVTHRKTSPAVIASARHCKGRCCRIGMRPM
jgi:mono/diheme cytochrome c family protein